MKPSNTGAKDLIPIEIAGFEPCRRLVGTVVENHGSANAEASIAIDRRHVWPVDAIMLKMLVKRLHAHGASPLRDQISQRIIDHRTDHTGLETEAVGQVRRGVKFAPA